MSPLIMNKKALKGRRKLLRLCQTDAEAILWSKLRGKRVSGTKFFRQFSIGAYILDFYSPTKRLAIELDGRHHAEGFQAESDKERDAYLKALDIKVIRFWNEQIFSELASVLETIYNEIELPLPPLDPKRGDSK